MNRKLRFHGHPCVAVYGLITTEDFDNLTDLRELEPDRGEPMYFTPKALERYESMLFTPEELARINQSDMWPELCEHQKQEGQCKIKACRFGK